MSEPGSHANPDYLSYSTFDLRKGDLEANRVGRISPGQKRQLMWSFVFQLIIALIVGAVVIGVAVGLSTLDVDSSRRWVLWIVYVVVAGVILIAAYSLIQQARDLLRGTVNGFKGRVYTEERESDNIEWSEDTLTTWRTTSYYVFLDTRKFKVSNKTYSFFFSDKKGREKPSFRVYYLPHSGRILGAERIADDKPETGPEPKLPPL